MDKLLESNCGVISSGLKARNPINKVCGNPVSQSSQLGLCLGQSCVEHPVPWMTCICICCIWPFSRSTCCENPYRGIHPLSFKVHHLGLAWRKTRIGLWYGSQAAFQYSLEKKREFGRAEFWGSDLRVCSFTASHIWSLENDVTVFCS